MLVRWFLACAGCALSLALASSAGASVMSGSYTAYLTDIDPALASRFKVGDLVEGSFQMQPDAVPKVRYPIYPNFLWYYFEEPFQSFSVTVGNYVGTSNPTWNYGDSGRNYVRVIDGEPSSGFHDVLGWRAGVAGESVNGLPVDAAGFLVGQSDGGAFNFESLSGSFTLSDFDRNDFYLAFFDESLPWPGAVRVARGTLSSLTLNLELPPARELPTPSSLSLLSLAILAIAYLSRQPRLAGPLAVKRAPATEVG